MKILNFQNMKGGWFIGDFEPTAYKTKDEVDINRGEIIDRIKDTKIPKKDVLNAIMSRPELKEMYGEGSRVHEYLTSF